MINNHTINKKALYISIVVILLLMTTLFIGVALHHRAKFKDASRLYKQMKKRDISLYISRITFPLSYFRQNIKIGIDFNDAEKMIVGYSFKREINIKDEKGENYKYITYQFNFGFFNLFEDDRLMLWVDKNNKVFNVDADGLGFNLSDIPALDNDVFVK